jgi:hypothetical protein
MKPAQESESKDLITEQAKQKAQDVDLLKKITELRKDID